ncbi:MAG: bifunctional precorrin-2 dehydrogenase/sirohydrochlorin ferrochelatase [Gemmatimonadetes bacterium]|jgi:siroheme synthase-like protein|nr:bifunctional precorrin-2 dehydrogenase/sirohydrochlorin ferrochelatase [Gemmatimonadota bacterium]MBT6146723.1 bifunctional precorrin-2 dehydrogenase/sirohydrochlorin ferrochelatase [Gemmatimonadota bacterium]MBT7860203.1 bifunctional precorrin-2 dehydrogenase/sirohydrochlorin ferrochelatase [Gemmatimonadota bacterium]
MATAVNNPFFQIGLDVLDQRCVVVGGNDEAADKAARLVDAGARVFVIAPEATTWIAEAARQGNLTWECRVLEIAGDLDETFLVMNTLPKDKPLCELIHAECRQRRILLNTYDVPDQSDFGMAALVQRGPLRVSISSSNTSPTLSGRLRRQLEAAFDDEFVAFLEQLGAVRRSLRKRITHGPDRRARLKSLVEGFRLKACVELPDGWRERLAKELGDQDATKHDAQNAAGV